MRKLVMVVAAAAAAVSLVFTAAAAPAGGQPKYDITTLAGKVASLNGTEGLAIRFSALIEQEAEETEEGREADLPEPGDPPITPDFVLSSPLDGTSILPPAVTVNQDTAGAPQNETAIAIDPGNSNRIVVAANDYVARTWACMISGTPCSALGDGYSGTYYSNDGGASWCCTSSDPDHIGTLIPGVTHLTGGPYEAGGDPALAFDSHGNVYYAGLGFNRTSAPNTVTVSKGTFDGGGALTWGPPTFLNATTAPAILNDKEWIAVDSHASSPFRDRVYVTWTRFLFSPGSGSYVQSPIMFASSSDGGRTFNAARTISDNVLYGQGSRPVVAPDGTLYVFWDGSTRLASLDSIYMVKSTDGGRTWSKPAEVSTVADSMPLRATAFRVNSYPAAAVAANGDVYATWTAEVPNDGSTAAGTAGCAYWLAGRPAVRANCHSAAVYSVSHDGGATWSDAAAVFAPANWTPVGYPVDQPEDDDEETPDTLEAPSLLPVEDMFPAAAASAGGKVYLGAYRGTVVSPWQTCAEGPPPPVGRIACDELGDYIHNARLEYVARDVTTDVTSTLSTHPINSRHGFGGGFIGDYTDMAATADGTVHAVWTDTNNVQNVTWFYGFEFVPTPINQEDVAFAKSNY